MPKNFDRRSFVQRAARIGGGIYLAPWLQGLLACAKKGDMTGVTDLKDYGALGPSPVSQLALPANFHAVVLSQSGNPMTNGAPTPNAFDGMAAFALPNGNIRLIRNHEMNDAAGTAVAFGDPATAYDSKGPGGTTSLEVRVRGDGTPELVKDFVSLNGTFNNCAGGPTPWGSWLSCEESTQGTTQGRTKPHGYVFEVAVSSEKEVTATPIKPMGRLVHEAIAIDGSGIVYLTEDRAVAPGAGFYRFLPTTNGNLLAGGKLQALALQGLPGHNTATGQTPGTVHQALWVDVDDPDPAAVETDASAVCRAVQAKGAAIFQRLEGCWYSSPDNNVYFHSTSGGNAGLGQVWKYHPTGSAAGELTLVFESTSADMLDSPDNITVSPRGGLLLCEDGTGGNFLRGLTAKGVIFPFAQNVLNDREFCGACFSPDGKILFVNIQGGATAGSTQPSFTFAIWGPWEKGAL